MKRLLAIAIFAFGLSTAPLVAETSPVVVELYTSQGCSSCPPADELLAKLAKRDDVLPLALHVDYWDYLGWKDGFADPAHSERQRGYAHVGGRKMIYTPQMIVMGQEDVVGAKGMELADLITAHKAKKPTVEITMDRDGKTLRVDLAAVDPSVSGVLDVHLVRFLPFQKVKVKRGENAGRLLGYANVVEDWSLVDQWDPKQPKELNLALEGDLPSAIVVQRPNYGPILAGARAD